MVGKHYIRIGGLHMLSVRDMTELIYIHEACDALNTTLLGADTAVCFHEGHLGALSRIHVVIERNAKEELKKNDYEGVWKIVDDTSLTPEQRAAMLVGDADTDKVSRS